MLGEPALLRPLCTDGSDEGLERDEMLDREGVEADELPEQGDR